MKVQCPTKCCMRKELREVSVPRTRLDLGISAGPCGFSSLRRPPPTCVVGFILPRASRLLQSFDERPASLACARETPSLGFHALIAALACGVHIRPETHPRASFRPRRFSRPRRLPPPQALRVCFTPQPRPGFALQGFVPLRGAVPAFAGPLMPSCRWTPRPLTSPCALDFRAFSLHGECGVERRRLKLRPIRAPPGLLLLRVSPSPHGDSAFTPSPHSTFTTTSPPPLVPCVSPMRGSVFLYPGHRPARGFRPELFPSFQR